MDFFQNAFKKWLAEVHLKHYMTGKLNPFCDTGRLLSMVHIVPKGRKQFVSIGGERSTSRLLTCRIPQGAVLGTLLDSLYTLQLGDIMRRLESPSISMPMTKSLTVCSRSQMLVTLNKPNSGLHQ